MNKGLKMKILLRLCTTFSFLLAVLLTSCSTPKKTFEIPLPKVSLKSYSNIKITTHGNAEILNYLSTKSKSIFKNNNCSIVDDNPDYWVIFYATSEKRIDTYSDNQHNIIYRKVSKEYGNRGEDVIEETKFKTATSALFVSVIIYDVKSMTPLVNFDFPFYSSVTSYTNQDPIPYSGFLSVNNCCSILNKILVFDK